MKKKSLYVFLVVVLVLSLTVTTVKADAPAPQGNIDSLMTTDDNAQVDENILPSTISVAPLSPLNDQVTFNRLPKLYFTKDALATAYKIYMYDLRVSNTVPLYTYKGGTENCGSGVCWLQPTTKLKPFKDSAGGYYAWKVSAKIGDSWQNNDTLAYFWVYSSGFTSTFDENTKDWEVVEGTWTRTPKGYYKTLGSLGSFVTAMNRNEFIDGIVIEARIKNKEPLGLDWSSICFLGWAFPLGVFNRWDHGYYFTYYNGGSWDLSKSYGGGNGVNIASGFTPAANPLDWNTFKIWVHNGYIYLWINGVYLGNFYDTTYDKGYVGLEFYKNSTEISPLLVDYFKVYYSGTLPQAIPADVETITTPSLDFMDIR